MIKLGELKAIIKKIEEEREDITDATYVYVSCDARLVMMPDTEDDSTEIVAIDLLDGRISEMWRY